MAIEGLLSTPLADSVGAPLSDRARRDALAVSRRPTKSTAASGSARCRPETVARQRPRAGRCEGTDRPARGASVPERDRVLGARPPAGDAGPADRRGTAGRRPLRRRPPDRLLPRSDRRQLVRLPRGRLRPRGVPRPRAGRGARARDDRERPATRTSAGSCTRRTCTRSTASSASRSPTTSCSRGRRPGTRARAGSARSARGACRGRARSARARPAIPEASTSRWNAVAPSSRWYSSSRPESIQTARRLRSVSRVLGLAGEQRPGRSAASAPRPPGSSSPVSRSNGSSTEPSSRGGVRGAHRVCVDEQLVVG